MTTTSSTAIKTRFLEIDAKAVDEDSFSLSFSSENPVPTPMGEEILSHKREAVDLSRLNDGAPFLWSHDPRTVLGVVESAEIVNGKGRAVVRWGTSEEAIAKRKEVAEGILQNISVGYQIEESEYTDDGKVFVSRWQPVEISLVAVPSDNSIGIHRSHPSFSSPKEEPKQMSYVTDGIAPPMETGEFATEAREFSIVKAIQASSSGNWSQAGRERECHEELVHRHGQRSAQGILIPNQSWQKRTYVAGTDSAGGNLIATDVLADQFVDALRPNSVIMSAGATTIPGLVGDVSIPKRTGSSTAAWFGADDSDALSESTGTFGTVTLTPKTVGSYSKFSRLMKLQSLPHIEDLIRQDMLEKIGTQIDIGAISGTGSSSQPTGILSASGTTVTALATNGAAASIDNLITLKKSVSAANADDSSCCYLINSKVESALSQLKDSNGQYHLNPFGGELGAARFAGRRMLVSNNVPSNLSKGSGSNLSAILYGRFSDVLIGQWSGVEIEIDPFTDFAKGTIGIRALATIDVGVRHGESFGLIKDAIAA